MGRKYWWPGALPDQYLLVQNFTAKLPTYATPLGFTPALMTKANVLCESILSAIDVTNQCRSAMQGVTKWRDSVLYGQPQGSPAGAAPVFPTIDSQNYNRGLVNQFFTLRDQIVSSSGYTLAIGEDLGIVGPETSGRPADDTAPSLKTVSSSTKYVTITGSMQGMPVMRVEYAAKGNTYGSVAIVTNLPATFEVEKVNKLAPELGTIRTIFMKKNADYGNYSPNYDVTIS